MKKHIQTDDMFWYVLRMQCERQLVDKQVGAKIVKKLDKHIIDKLMYQIWAPVGIFIRNYYQK